MSLTPPRYTPAEIELMAFHMSVTVTESLPPARTLMEREKLVQHALYTAQQDPEKLAGILRHAAGQARVLDRLREEVTNRIVFYEAIHFTEMSSEQREAHDHFVWVHRLLARLLREEGVTPRGSE